MANEYAIQVEHDGLSFNTAIRADEDVDQLLLKSLHHFDLNPDTKSDWTLVRLSRERRADEEGLTLGRKVAAELDDGDRVGLRRRDVDREEPATGSY